MFIARPNAAVTAVLKAAHECFLPNVREIYLSLAAEILAFLWFCTISNNHSFPQRICKPVILCTVVYRGSVLNYVVDQPHDATALSLQTTIQRQPVWQFVSSNRRSF